MLAVYAIVNGNEAGWMSAQTITLLGLAVMLKLAFLIIETRSPAPLMPLSMFRLRNVSAANAAGVLWAAAMFAWFFISALYMQLVLGFSAMQVGLAFLPANIIMAMFSLGLSANLVMRFGFRLPLAGGLLLAATGLALFSRMPVQGTFLVDVLPGMVLLGLGAGIAFNPFLLAAMSDVKPEDAGIASGMVNTSFMMGGALGLAILSSLSEAKTEAARAAGLQPLAALTDGYRTAFTLAAAFALLAAGLGAWLIRDRQMASESHPVATH
jgi:predicted MFS family arabinose efflux permease